MGDRVGSRGMGVDRQIFVADAAKFLGVPDACRLIHRAWRQGAIHLFGVRPGESEPVAIPANEGRIDFAHSRIVTGPFVWFQNVTMPWSDVKRLAQADVERLAQTDIELLAQRADSERLARNAETDASPPPTRQDADASVAEAEASALVREVMTLLRLRYPGGRPPGSRTAIFRDLRDSAGFAFEITTMDRAMRSLGWTKRRAKAHQT